MRGRAQKILRQDDRCLIAVVDRKNNLVHYPRPMVSRIVAEAVCDGFNSVDNGRDLVATIANASAAIIAGRLATTSRRLPSATRRKQPPARGGVA